MKTVEDSEEADEPPGSESVVKPSECEENEELQRAHPHVPEDVSGFASGYQGES